jgi:hypothetical protein
LAAAGALTFTACELPLPPWRSTAARTARVQEILGHSTLQLTMSIYNAPAGGYSGTESAQFGYHGDAAKISRQALDAKCLVG